EMDFSSLGEKRVALFALIPDNDSSLNFIIGMLYTQLFQELYYRADHVHDGRLPVHVHCVMDEFANGVTRFQLKRLGVKPKNIMKIERSFEDTMVS
ncbi:MAG: type IV secretory system conjugative DNA transfer family protein, partial [Pseudoflavonifractor sp.]|nr:type IV secretory system conjugative DNA transfer family protein [Pseudoflavonifractor sp.]